MVHHRLDHSGWGGDHICTDTGTVEDVVHGPDRGCEDLRLEAVIVVDGADIFDQLHAVDIDVVEAADEGLLCDTLRLEGALDADEVTQLLHGPGVGLDTLFGGRGLQAQVLCDLLEPFGSDVALVLGPAGQLRGDASVVTDDVRQVDRVGASVDQVELLNYLDEWSV